MAIKFVMNGWFRSGTTILWKVMKESNPKLLHFYEPFSLAYHKSRKIFYGDVYANREKLRRRSIKLHGFYPYEDYEKNGLYEKCLMMCEERYDPIVSRYDESVREYLDFFHTLGQDCTLQPNRCHFILKEIQKDFGCNVLHIIRNPYRQVKSFKRSMSFLQKIYHTIFPERQFGLKKCYDVLYNEFNITQFKPRNFYEYFAVCWYFINVYPWVADVPVMWFDAFLEEVLDGNYERVVRLLEKYTGLNWDEEVIKRNIVPEKALITDPKDVEKLERAIENMGLKNEYEDFIEKSSFGGFIKCRSEVL